MGSSNKAEMKTTLSTLPLSGKVTLTLFLFLLWYGYILAGLNARLAVGISSASIAEHYGDHSITSSEAKDIEAHGFSEEEVVIDDHENHGGGEKRGGESITPQELVQLGHVHILGFSLLFIALGIILFLSRISEALKASILVFLFLSFALDIGGLFFVRFVSDTYAPVPLVSGIGTGVGIAVISLIALYDMWLGA